MDESNTINKMIPLVEDYYFSADENQYILYRCGKRNKIDIKTKKSTGEVIDFTEVRKVIFSHLINHPFNSKIII